MSTTLSPDILEPPRSAIATILHGLITRTEISERMYPFNGFRTRISDLRLKHRLNVRFKQKSSKNQFGHPMIFRVHYLWYSELPKARRLYRRINHG